MRRHGQDDQVGVTQHLGGGDGARPGGEHVDGQRDAFGRSRPRDGDVVAGRDRQPGDRGAQLAGPDDAQAERRLQG